ncbi:MAG TPA: hypothetical protein VKE74_20695 [Gemmataceae bacterium]|nr:hypothetical protein [Gemmataceae bacterium]
MQLPPLPPTHYVLPELQLFILPAAGGAAFVMCLFLVLGRWAGALGSAVAVVVAFAWANFTFTELKWEKTHYLIPWKPDDPDRAWLWLPRAALVLVIVGLVSRWVGLIAGRLLTKPVVNYFGSDAIPEREGRYWWGANLLTWAPRAAAVLVVSGWLISERVASEMPLLRWELAGVMLLSWVALDGVARGGASGQVAAYQWAMFLAAGAILIYAHSLSFMEIANVLAFAMLGVAVAAGSGRADASGAVPAGVAFLPGLMLAARQSLADNNVPANSFWLIALAPVVLLPFLIPAVARQNKWLVIPLRTILVLAPLVVAVVLAGQHEQIVFPEERY